MHISFDYLLDSKPENLKRLARFLGVPVPDLRDEWIRHRVLARDVMTALLEDKRRAQAERQREMDKAAITKTALDIAAGLGENGERQIQQIKRILRLMGDVWTRERATEAIGLYSSADPVCLRKDGQCRTMGGVFFEVCRREATKDVKAKRITRREFFRCFFDRPARAKKPVPPAKAQRPTAVMNGGVVIENVPGVVKHTTRGGKGPVGRLHDRRSRGPMPEVYVRKAR